MAAPATTDEFLDLVRKSGVVEEKRLDPWLQKNRSSGLPAKPNQAAGLLVRDGILTDFQAEQILQGKWRRFTIGKYKVLEKLGSGGMGSVYLCEHKLMRRRVAVKVLPTAKAADESSLQRFYREARAVAALDHPNIVHAYDIDQDENLHFLVMEYVDGANLQEIIKRSGPMDVERACHYIRQSALGLEHANLAGLIHRDIKPGNILIDRTGLVKILDMGLARFFNDEDDVLTKKFDENVLGTADYLAPEQAQDSHTVDVRADIYSLGATFYFLLTGRTIFGEGTVAQKLMWHMSRQPKPVNEYRPEVPAELAAILTKMLQKEPANRYQQPSEVAAALEPFTQNPIGPPTEKEMPQLSLAATGVQVSVATADTAVTKRNEAPPIVPKALQGMSSKIPSRPAASAPASGSPTSGSPTSGAPAPSSRPPASPRPAPSSKSAPAPKPSPKPSPRPAAAGSSPVPAPKPSPAAAAATAAAAPASAPVSTPKPTPRPAPAPPAVQTLTPPEVEVPGDESAPWEDLSSVDTEDPAAKADTAPRSSRSARRLVTKDGVNNKKRAWMIFGFLAIAAGVGLIASLIYVFMNRERTTVVTRAPLEITRDAGKPNTYRGIAQALRVAQAGDVIQIADEVHFENLLVEKKPNLATDVTVEAAPGISVVWKSRSNDPSQPLLKLQNAAGFKLRGKNLTLDGAIDAAKGVNDLIEINFTSPGLTIEDITLKNFKKAGIRVVNVWGAKDRPARLLNLTASAPTTTDLQAVIFFHAIADTSGLPYNDFVEVGGIHAPGLKAHAQTDNTVLSKNVVLSE